MSFRSWNDRLYPLFVDPVRYLRDVEPHVPTYLHEEYATLRH
jgi:hypothetical protein